ncbi:MAG: hypothetical protein AB1487_11350 [Thermodesulfobacteriota bacterium]
MSKGTGVKGGKICQLEIDPARVPAVGWEEAAVAVVAGAVALAWGRAASVFAPIVDEPRPINGEYPVMR